MNWDKLFKEAPFREALEVCRWEAYAAVLADLTIIAEGYLRPHAAPRHGELAEWLAEAFDAGVAAYPLPAHRPQGWGREQDALRRRLAAAQSSSPEPVHRIGRVAGARIFDLLPIHPTLRRYDRDLIRDNVRFGLCRSYEDMEKRVKASRVAGAALAGRG